jgi:hypothetical protein
MGGLASEGAVLSLSWWESIRGEGGYHCILLSWRAHTAQDRDSSRGNGEFVFILLVEGWFSLLAYVCMCALLLVLKCMHR